MGDSLLISPVNLLVSVPFFSTCRACDIIGNFLWNTAPKRPSERRGFLVDLQQKWLECCICCAESTNFLPKRNRKFREPSLTSKAPAPHGSKTTQDETSGWMTIQWCGFLLTTTSTSVSLVLGETMGNPAKSTAVNTISKILKLQLDDLDGCPESSDISCRWMGLNWGFIQIHTLDLEVWR